MPVLFAGWFDGPLAYRPLFALVLITSATSLWLISRVPDGRETRRRKPAPSEVALGLRENALLLRLAFANLLQGAALGLSGPLTAYWFAVRFGQGPALLGPLAAATLILAALASLGAGRLAQRHGIVPVVITLRAVAIGLQVALPLAPNLASAAFFYVAGSLFNRSTNGARQALSIGLVRAKRRGLAASLNSISLSVPRAAGPLIAGLLFDSGHLALPFLIAAGLNVCYLCVYGWSFAEHDRATRGAAGAAASP